MQRERLSSHLRADLQLLHLGKVLPGEGQRLAALKARSAIAARCQQAFSVSALLTCIILTSFMIVAPVSGHAVASSIHSSIVQPLQHTGKPYTPSAVLLHWYPKDGPQVSEAASLLDCAMKPTRQTISSNQTFQKGNVVI